MFKIGEKIAYPMHGAGVITGIETKDFLGEKKEYYNLKINIGNMNIAIPTDKIKEMNIRPIITKEEGFEIIRILESKPDKLSGNWTKRHRENQETLKSGDIFKIAQVVRNLMAFDHEKGLSTTEKKLLNQARRIVASELVMAESISEKKADLIFKDSTGL